MTSRTIGAGKCARLLAKLSGLMQVHLIMEDAFFYARAERFDNPTVRALCKRFQAEYDLFRPSFKVFLEQFSGGSAVEKSPDRFQKEVLLHFDWLRRRMAREERELFQSFETVARIARSVWRSRFRVRAPVRDRVQPLARRFGREVGSVARQVRGFM